ncbi:hypothetical protein GCM10022276_11690 [Sphingomonas limnosediminicola]|uniref:Transglycosylase SLT domain-containing protein n=1 Tax=Sphingomonas limnosediminicola TaxID=940133 RepID=A0ABP7L4S9_9SPHN
MSVTGAAKPGPSAHVLRSIADASQKTGVSFDYLFNQARSESGFNPAARAPTSSASGLYQFTRQTWLATLDAHGAEHGLGWTVDAIQRLPGGRFAVGDADTRQAILDLRSDPTASAAMAAELASDNGNFLSRELGRDATATDLALAHFLGAEGAAKFLTAFAANPDASAAPLFPEAAAANRAVFYDQGGAPRSLAAIHTRFAAMAGGEAPAQPRPATFHQEVSSETRSSGWSGATPNFEPMPKHLSLSFAQAAYRRLQAMGSGQ